MIHDTVSETDRDSLYRVINARRDVRRHFRPDPVPDDVLLRVLAAAHAAPSVGLSQPWDFPVITDVDVRRSVAAHVERPRRAFAEALPSACAAKFAEQDRIRPRQPRALLAGPRAAPSPGPSTDTCEHVRDLGVTAMRDAWSRTVDSPNPPAHAVSWRTAPSASPAWLAPPRPLPCPSPAAVAVLPADHGVVV